MTIKRCYSVLVGASVAENQLINAPESATYIGLTFTTADNVINMNGTTTATYTQCFGSVTLQANHVYALVSSFVSNPDSLSFKVGALNASGLMQYVGTSILYKRSSNIWTGLGIESLGTGTVFNNVKIKANVIDLTLLFGSAIADYVYTLEQATAGSGIAWLRSYGFLTDDYISYNAGTIESVEATAKVVRDENNENAVTYPLGTDTLRGIFKLDANNKLYADGDRKESDGTITRRYGVVTLDGSESGWGMSGYTSNNTYIISIPDVAVYADVNSISNIVSSGMPAISFADGYNNNNIFGIAVGNSAHELRVNVPISVINRDITAFKTWLTSNPLTVVYEKTTSTTETSTPFTSPQIVYPDGTEEFVTENGVPVGHETKYQL